MIELENKILEYFNRKNKILEVLDNKYRDFYTGVTLNYITYNLLKAKYRKKDVAKALLTLHTNKKIKSLFCGDVKNVVFMNKNITYWNYDINDISYNSDRKCKYDYFINYLNKYINV